MKNKERTVLSDEELELLLHRLCNQGDYYFATTPDSVEQEEKRQAQEDVDQYEFSCISEFSEKSVLQSIGSMKPSIDTSFSTDLARAARMGRKIPKEIEERMAADRASAELTRRK